MRNILFVTALMVFLTGPLVFAADFEDLPPGHWAYDAVAALQKAGIILPFPDGEFKGDTLVTRYDVALYIDRTIEYLVSNVEYMNHQQAVLLTEILQGLLSEFRNELIMLSLDIRDLERKLDGVRRVSTWRFGVETEAFVTLSRFEETAPGVQPKFDRETQFGVGVGTQLIGQTERYSIDVRAKALMFRSNLVDEVDVTLDQFHLEADNHSGLFVRVGDLNPSQYNGYLLADAEEVSLWGMQVVSSDNFVLFNDGLELMYAVPTNQATVLDHTGFALARFGHRSENSQFDMYGGLKINDAAFDEYSDGILGLDARMGGGPFVFDVGLATESLDAFYRMLSVGFDLSESTHTSVTYINADKKFDGLYSDVNKGASLVGRVELEAGDRTTLYGEVASQLPLRKQGTTVEIGMTTEGVWLASLSTAHAHLSYNSDKGVGANAVVHFDEASNVRFSSLLPLRTGGEFKISVQAISRAGALEVDAGYESNKTSSVKKTSSSAGLGLWLNEDTRFRFTWETTSENGTVLGGAEIKETVTGLSLNFSF